MVAKQNKDFLNFHAHFSTTISQAIRDYVTNEVLIKSRYIFTKRAAGVQFGHCTHCNKRFQTDGLKHNDVVHCPKCNSKCTVKASGISRKHLIDGGYVVYYEKSKVSPKAIVARGMYVSRDYTGDYAKVETQYNPLMLYLFEPGKSTLYRRYWSDSGWFREDSMLSEFGKGYYPVAKCSYGSIREAVRDTNFQYSMWEKYHDGDMVKFFGLFSVYPCIEYLTKMGLQDFVEDKLYNRKTYGAVNWRGKGINQVLKLTKQQLNEVKDTEILKDMLMLRLYQISKKDGSNLTIDEIKSIRKMLDCGWYRDNFEDFKKFLKHTTVRRAHSYIQNQFRRPDEKKRYQDIEQVLITWRDYIRDCATLEMDLTQERILFPSNLFASHQKTTTMVKVQADELFNRKIAKRAEALQKYCFELGDLFIRPALSSDELIAEGKVLNHCVGTYAEGYANGKTCILLIRKKTAADKPFFTMEVKGDRIIQTQGLKHCLPEGDVKKFVDAFKAERIDKKSTRKTDKPKTAQPA